MTCSCFFSPLFILSSGLGASLRLSELQLKKEVSEPQHSQQLFEMPEMRMGSGELSSQFVSSSDPRDGAPNLFNILLTLELARGH